MTATADRRRARLEILAVLLTGGVFLVFENVLRLKLPFLAVAFAAWAGYLISRIRREPSVVEAWGLGRAHLRPATLACAAFLVAGGTAVVLFHLAFGGPALPSGALVVAGLYPVWGLIQQFLIQAMVTRNLRTLSWPPAAILPVSAALFGFAHVPDLPLVLLTAGSGLAWTGIYLRAPNLYPLALAHGGLGTLAFYWVLRRDPWQELFPG